MRITSTAYLTVPGDSIQPDDDGPEIIFSLCVRVLLRLTGPQYDLLIGMPDTHLTVNVLYIYTLHLPAYIHTDI